MIKIVLPNQSFSSPDKTSSKQLKRRDLDFKRLYHERNYILTLLLEVEILHTYDGRRTLVYDLFILVSILHEIGLLFKERLCVDQLSLICVAGLPVTCLVC